MYILIVRYNTCIPTNLQINFCLIWDIFASKCCQPLQMHGPDLSQVVTKMKDLEGWVPFLLDIQAKSWMVGRYARVEVGW